MKLEELKRYGVTQPRHHRAAVAGSDLRTILPGALQELTGTSFAIDNAYDESHVHGLHALGKLTALSAENISVICRDPELRYVELNRAVFLDTETTGLGMGTGTYVFLLGAGYLDKGRFVVRQFFLDGPQDERGFLAAVAEFLSSFAVVVTFNGKAFDWPLISSRFIRWHRALPFEEPSQVDLLHASRRLWKRRLESCSLASLERSILRIQRTEADVPGYEIPARYFRYLRERDGHELSGVFYHNLQDVLSLAGLALHIDAILEDPGCGLLEDAIDFFSLGRALDRAGEPETAAMCFMEAIDRGLPREMRRECLIELGTLQKRERAWDAAVQTWYRLVDEGGVTALQGLLELAKYREHVERDYEAAIEDVRQAILLAAFYHPASPDASIEALEHRLARLVNRASRSTRSRWSPAVTA